MLVLMIDIFLISSFCYLPFDLSHIFTFSFLCYCFLRRMSLRVFLSHKSSHTLHTHTQLSPLSLLSIPSSLCLLRLWGKHISVASDIQIPSGCACEHGGGSHSDVWL